MLKIKGIDILLHGTDGTAEIVSNVLVGEPTTASLPFGEGLVPAYTLAIPKGDTRIWENRIVSFFGQMFRTVGTVEQGIEANVPTAWHKKIHAELFTPNGACTVYEKDTFRRHLLSDVFLSDRRDLAHGKSGSAKQGDLHVYLYAVSGAEYIPKSGDYLIPSEAETEIDTTSEQTISKSLADLRSMYPDYAVVHDVKRIGSDHEIMGR